MLDPTWLTDAIYTILTKTKESLNNGEFQKEALSEWLSQKDYNETHHDYVLEMMQHKDIGLCFKLPDVEPETYLVPEALGVQTPHLNIKDDALRFRYRYDILPDGLIPRFIVEANRYLPENCARWRTGVTLELMVVMWSYRAVLRRSRLIFLLRIMAMQKEASGTEYRSFAL